MTFGCLKGFFIIMMFRKNENWTVLLLDHPIIDIISKKGILAVVCVESVFPVGPSFWQKLDGKCISEVSKLTLLEIVVGYTRKWFLLLRLLEFLWRTLFHFHQKFWDSNIWVLISTFSFFARFRFAYSQWAYPRCHLKHYQ